MKTLMRLSGIVVAAIIVIGASRLWAENKEKKPAPRTRIGLLNLSYTIKNYDKYKKYQEEIKHIIEPYQKRDTKLRARLDKLRSQGSFTAENGATPLPPPPSPPMPLPTYLETPTTKKKSPKDSDVERVKAEEEEDEMLKPKDIEMEMKKLQRQLEDNQAEAKLKLAQKSDTEMRVLYMDVYEAAQRYAATHKLDLIMHYNDAVTKEEYLSAPNIARKLNTGALMPMYAASGIDITKDITEKLNKNIVKK